MQSRSFASRAIDQLFGVYTPTWQGQQPSLYHHAHSRRTEESPVEEHFNSDQDTLADITVMAIDQVHSHNPCLCKIGKSRWIRTLGTSYPSGMNLRVNSL